MDRSASGARYTTTTHRLALESARDVQQVTVFTIVPLPTLISDVPSATSLDIVLTRAFGEKSVL